eukprot:CAMPEP_0170811766 /NCGR_PEP_ID=MMETSP0733-20121128/35490_1 /TAXON_ID=186038 /ORGANISM="Fragilariopsis kerguelensis, Strain L26-C5" /LENGTH=64 /DNA_ID=CAMNT_0011168059 /DNA_START=191 /DNA_END=381 /DNA_ORIENTATION=-
MRMSGKYDDDVDDDDDDKASIEVANKEKKLLLLSTTDANSCREGANKKKQNEYVNHVKDTDILL